MESDFSSVKDEGNVLYKAEDYVSALEKYREASETEDLVLKAVCYGNIALCYISLHQPEEALQACNQALELNPEYVKVRDRKIRLLIDKGEYRLAKETAEGGQCSPAIKREAERLAEEQFEKDKAMMMGQLKDLGNTVLGKFGLSLDNFKVAPTEGGSYSINFSK
jgi:valyl-tRNA synthetase